jgi:hypothetical protein
MATTKVRAYTLSAAARAIGCSPTHVARLIAEGVLTESEAVQGSGRYVTAETVERYAKQREEEASTNGN